jgi:hypothetical protein
MTSIGVDGGFETWVFRRVHVVVFKQLVNHAVPMLGTLI